MFFASNTIGIILSIAGNTSMYRIEQYNGERDINKGLIAGAAIATVVIFIGIISGGNIAKFLSPASLILVLGGTISAALIHFSIKDLACAWKSFCQILFEREISADQRIVFLVNLAQKVRKEGTLVMEEIMRRTSDNFLQRAIGVTVDGQDPMVIRKILETEMRTSYDQENRSSLVFQTMGSYAPALGLIGTLIGLIQMMGALNDPSSIGPAMGLALVCTLYGAILANLVFLPVAGKIKNRTEEEFLLKTLTLEGILCIRRDENPIVIGQRLEGFLTFEREAA